MLKALPLDKEDHQEAVVSATAEPSNIIDLLQTVQIAGQLSEA
jgi:hypothetical protein